MLLIYVKLCSRQRYFSGSDEAPDPQDNKGTIAKSLSGEQSSRNSTLDDPTSDSSNDSAGVEATMETDVNPNQRITQSNDEPVPTPPRPRANTGEEDYAKAREELLFL